jgi:F-type H+-transporting ATPase subunit delta
MASVTTTYARAFADAVLARQQDTMKVLTEARSLSAMVASNKELREVWETPSIPAEQKRGVLDAIAAREGLSPIARNFVAVLIDHGRIRFLDPIVKQFEKEIDNRLGFAEAEITSARDLSDEDKRELEVQIALVTGKKIRARYSRDPSLLGGAVVKVGSTIYDGSISGRLERMRQALSN